MKYKSYFFFILFLSYNTILSQTHQEIKVDLVDAFTLFDKKVNLFYEIGYTNRFAIEPSLGFGFRKKVDFITIAPNNFLASNSTFVKLNYLETGFLIRYKIFKSKPGRSVPGPLIGIQINLEYELASDQKYKETLQNNTLETLFSYERNKIDVGFQPYFGMKWKIFEHFTIETALFFNYFFSAEIFKPYGNIKLGYIIKSGFSEQIPVEE